MLPPLTSAEEALVDSGAKSLTQLVLQTLGRTGRRIVEQHRIELALKADLETYIRRHGQIKALLMPQPVPLREIYTDVEVVSPKFLARQLTVDEMQALFRKGRRSLFTGDRREDGMTTANRIQFLNVLGAPGAGKSTLLKRIGLEALVPRRTWRSFLTPHNSQTADSKYEHRLLPVFVELRQFRWQAPDLVAAIRNEFEACGFPESSGFVERGLRSGRFLLLLDGIDEVPEEKLDVVLSAMRNLVSRWPKNRFITSCRTAYYKSFLNNFTDVVVADLTDESIKEFARCWFSSPEDRALKLDATFWSELEADSPTLELARTPLLLTFICLSYDNTQRLQANRSALYSQALEILMQRWAAEKRIQVGQALKQLAARTETDMLASLAAPLFSQDRLFFDRAEVLSSFAGYINSHANAPPLTPEELLAAIEVEQGLLVCRGGLLYSFSHVTLHEYFAAFSYQDEEHYRPLLPVITLDDRWHEVILLLAGMVKGDNIVRLVRERVGSRVFARDFLRDTMSFVGRRSELVAHAATVAGRLMRMAAVLALWSAFRVVKPLGFATSAEKRLLPTIFDRLLYLARAIVKRQRENPRHSKADASPYAASIEHFRAVGMAFNDDEYFDLDHASRRAVLIAADRARKVITIWKDLGLLGSGGSDAINDLTHFGGESVSFLALSEVMWKVLAATRFRVLFPRDEELKELSEYIYGSVLLWETAHSAYGLSVGEWQNVDDSILRVPSL